MPKEVPNIIFDAALDEVATGDRIRVLSAYTLGDTHATVVTNTLADGALTPGDGGGDFTIADGDTSGRKITIEQQVDLPIGTTGDANHVAITLDASTQVNLVTTTPTQSLTSGGTVTVNAYDYEITDPV
jgi:hypothetical protein